MMQYDTIAELPDTVRDSLPELAQEIYRQAFNRGWRQYSNPWTRRGAVSQEALAHKAAWTAVKEKYQKDEGRWVRRANWT